MYDSITAADIPAGAAMVAGYVDGRFAWSVADWARFPNAVKVRIAVGQNPANAQVADVESGDYLPWEAVDFVLAQRAKGIDPTVYVSLSNWAPTQTEFRLRGVPEPHWWIADYDGLRVIPAGAVAKQFINPPGSGGHFDLSVVADFWAGVDYAAGAGGGSIGAVVDPAALALLQRLDAAVFGVAAGAKDAQGYDLAPYNLGITGKLNQIIAALTDIQNTVHSGAGGGGLTAAQAATLAHVEAMLTGGLKGS